MNKIKSFFKLIRWTNLLMIAIMMLLVYYCLMSPLSYYYSSVLPPAPAFLLLVMSLVFIVAGGYVINDYFDVEIDKYNKPDKLLITKVFSEKDAIFSYRILTFVGLSLGLASSIVALHVKFYMLFAILILLTCLLYSYSRTYKKKLVLGNIIVSFSVAIAVFLPYLFEILYLSENLLLLSVCKEIVITIVYFVLIYTMFAFLLTFIREIVKDAEDVDGDGRTHCRTIPVVYGISKTKAILYIFVLLLSILLLAYGYILFKMELYVTLAIIMLVLLCLLFLVVKIYKANGKRDFHSLSIMTKIMMFIGLLSMLFLR